MAAGNSPGIPGRALARFGALDDRGHRPPRSADAATT